LSAREAWRLSDVGFVELSVQAIYAYRQGNVAPPVEEAQLVRIANRRVWQSKFLVSLLLTFLALGAYFLLHHPPVGLFPATLSAGYFDGAVIGGLLTIEIALLWWTALQVLPTLLSSGILPLLETLPIDDQTLDRTALFLYLRLFDGPAVASLVLLPVAVGLALGSVGAGLVTFAAVAVSITFSLVLALLTGRFFLERVQGAPSGGAQTVLRWAYLLLWAIPAFALYGFVSAAPGFLSLLANLVANGPSASLYLLEGIFPFSFGFLASATSGSGLFGTDNTQLLAALTGVVLCGLVAAAAVRWLVHAPRALVQPGGSFGLSETPEFRPLKTGAVSLAVLIKDLRTASRTPAYAFLILLPLLDSLAIGLYTYSAVPGPSAAFNLAIAAISTAALLATFFGPAFFAIEVLGYNYTRTLPMEERSLLLGKVALVSLIYLLASALVLGLTLLRLFDPGLFVLFILAELPAVLAASLFELGILFYRARRKGLPIVNLYAGAWWLVGVAVPGVILAGAPLVAYDFYRAAPLSLGLPLMGSIALAELAVVAPLVLGLGREAR
jgi:predicted permease